MVDILLGGFWSLTYLIIIVLSLRYRSERKVFMPLIAGMLNFGWEICALYSSGGYWVHVVWLILDCMILAYNTVILGDYKKRLIYLALLITFTCLLYRVFQSASFDGMLISSFAIDAISLCIGRIKVSKDSIISFVGSIKSPFLRKYSN